MDERHLEDSWPATAAREARPDDRLLAVTQGDRKTVRKQRAARYYELAQNDELSNLDN